MEPQPKPPRAEPFQKYVVPAILGPAAERMVEAAELQPGERVLDVACGTGAATRPAARAVGSGGRVIGVDLDKAMLDVARAVPQDEGASIEWRQGDGMALPVEDGSFDAVLCAEGLQFFPDPVLGLTEMRRVLVPGGRVAVAVWGAPSGNPYFEALHGALHPRLSPDPVARLLQPFALAEPDRLQRLFEDAGWSGVRIETALLLLQLPGVEEFIPRHFTAMSIADELALLTREDVEGVIEDVRSVLRRSQDEHEGRVPFTIHLASARRLE